MSNRIITKVPVTGVEVTPKLKFGMNEVMEPIQGFVSLTLHDSEGNIISSENHNQIVYIGRHHLARVVFHDTTLSSGTEYADTLKVAGGAVAPGGDHFNPTAPAITDTGLFETNTSNIKSFAFDSVGFSPTSQSQTPVVTLSKTLISTDVKMLVNELGVFFGAAGPMLAHYTCSTLDLREDAGTSLEVVWMFML